MNLCSDALASFLKAEGCVKASAYITRGHTAQQAGLWKEIHAASMRLVGNRNITMAYIISMA